MISPALKRRALLLAARALNNAAARAYELATAEERRQREKRRAEAERIVADGEAALAEYVNGRAMLEYAEQELALAGKAVPRRLIWEMSLWSRLRREAGEAIENADPEQAKEAVEGVLALARLASRHD
jgi:hypothetical protein